MPGFVIAVRTGEGTAQVQVHRHRGSAHSGRRKTVEDKRDSGHRKKSRWELWVGGGAEGNLS